MTFTQLQEKIGTQNESEWHQHPNGGGWVHNTASVCESVYISESAIVMARCKLGEGCELGIGDGQSNFENKSINNTFLQKGTQ